MLKNNKSKNEILDEKTKESLNLDKFITLIRVAMYGHYGTEDNIRTTFKNIEIISDKKEAINKIKKVSQKYNLDEQIILEKFNNNNIITIGKRKKIICLNNCENINVINLLEFLTYEINYIYNFKDTNEIFRIGLCNKNREYFNKEEQIIKEILNILQTEEIIKIILELLENKEVKNDLFLKQQIDIIKSNDYKCTIYQMPTNILRPIFNEIKLLNYKEILKYIKKINEIESLETIIHLLKSSDDILILNFNGEFINNQLEMAENYRIIKDLVRKICIKCENEKRRIS